MKSLFAAALAMTFTSAAFAHDVCREKALNAAENDYGNDPMKTEVQTITKGSEYHVNVGIGNPEDGEHSYLVTFPAGCDQQATVTEVQN